MISSLLFLLLIFFFSIHFLQTAFVRIPFASATAHSHLQPLIRRRMACCKFQSRLLPLLRPCADLCLLNNPGLVYSSHQELRTSRSHRLKHWVPARHSGATLLHSPRSPVGGGGVGGGAHYQADLRAADFLWMLSVQQSVSSSPTACMHVCSPSLRSHDE